MAALHASCSSNSLNAFVGNSLDVKLLLWVRSDQPCCIRHCGSHMHEKNLLSSPPEGASLDNIPKRGTAGPDCWQCIYSHTVSMQSRALIQLKPAIDKHWIWPQLAQILTNGKWTQFKGSTRSRGSSLKSVCCYQCQLIIACIYGYEVLRIVRAGYGYL